MKIKNLVFFMITATVSLGTSAFAADHLSKYIFVNHAWVQAMPPSQKITAAYMTMTNNSSKEITIVSASSDIAGATEIHEMGEMKGMMHMAMMSSLHIPAHGKLVLQPGGFHIMLINLKKSVNKGDIVPITLHFKDGESLTIHANVRAQ